MRITILRGSRIDNGRRVTTWLNRYWSLHPIPSNTLITRMIHPIARQFWKQCPKKPN